MAERYYLTGVEVCSADNVGSIVCLGDSITDGRGSTPDADRRWPDRLAERLNEQGVRLGVVNAGISGNRILPFAGDNLQARALSRPRSRCFKSL